ncbi:hypothetical protein BAIN110137_08750 [Bacillus inaquosorum]
MAEFQIETTGKNAPVFIIAEAGMPGFFAD